MRLSCLVITALIALSTSLVAGDAAAERQRRVRVAIALAGDEARPVVRAAECCRTDYSTAVAEALREGKPLVLFVMADCGGRGAGLDAGMIAVRLDSYSGDNAAKPEAERVIILTPNSDRRTLTIRKTLPADATVEQIREATEPPKTSTTPALASSEWFASAETEDEEDLQPIQFSTCRGGTCTAGGCTGPSCTVQEPTAIPQPMPGPVRTWTATNDQAARAGKPRILGRIVQGVKHAVQTFTGRGGRGGRGGCCGR